MTQFIVNRIKSLKYVLIGVFKLVCKEPPIWVHLFTSLILSVLGFYFDITKTEWLFQIFAIGFVLAIEGLNTAVEKICDFIHPDFHHKIGLIKDISGGAVGFAVGAVTIVLVIIYYPYFFG